MEARRFALEPTYEGLKLSGLYIAVLSNIVFGAYL